MVEVALINPPSPYLTNDAAYPPMGLLYLAGKLERLGHEVKVIDLAGGQKFQYSDLTTTELVGITCTTPNVETVKELISWLKGYPILVGGAHPTFMPETFLGGEVSTVVGEADKALEYIMADFQGRGLRAFYIGGHVPVSEIVRPARHLVTLERYSPGGWQGSTVVYTSRGCPFSCRFCSKPSGNTYRPFPQEMVLEDVQECIGRGFKRIVFGDDNISIDRGRMKSLLRALGPLGIEYRLNQDARWLSQEMAELAHRTGCVEVSFGLESGSQRMLDAMNKQTTVAQVRKTIRTAHDAGLRTKAYLVLNFPGETPKSVHETLWFLEETRPDKVFVSSFVPLPGSYVWEHPQEFGIDRMSDNWSDYYLTGKGGDAPIVFTAKGLSAEQQRANRTLLKDGMKELGY